MRKPVIGVTCSPNEAENRISLHCGNMDALLAAGALPVALPLTDEPQALQAMVDSCDGFLFSGGGDVDPLLFRQSQKPFCGGISPKRDAMELGLAALLIARRDKPVLGICRGFQVMNIALGGDVYQDIAAEYPGDAIAHRQKQPEQYPSHQVIVTMSSLLDVVTHAHQLMVNSLHHQAVRRLGEGFLPCGVAPDGIIEAAALEGHPFFLGVQWHPERMWQTDAPSMDLFRALVEACDGTPA